MSNLKTLVISLVRAKQRRERSAQELSKTNLNWSFLDAVDGALFTTPPEGYPTRKVRRLLGFDMTPNEIGCFLSHQMAWQTCVDNNQTTLIFEDDFILLAHFENTVQTLLNDYHDWELIRLQALVESDYEIIQSIGNIQIVKNHSDPLGATAYLVKPSAAKILLEHSKQIYEPLDHFLEHFEKHNIRFYAALPYAVDISKAPSTISDRPNDRKPVKGLRKKIRSINRFLDRIFSSDPWFPK